MTLLTPFETIRQLIIFLEINPTRDHIVNFLSKHIDPYGEIAGVGWVILNSQGLFEYPQVAGMKIESDTNVKVDITADNPVVESLRLEKLMIWDMRRMYQNYSDALHKNDFDPFETGMGLPLSKTCIIAISFYSKKDELKEYEGYFECIRLVLAQWLARFEFGTTPLASIERKISKTLTARQVAILGMIRESMTNRSIGLELGFSESLIRQETIIIYRKLGVSGRRDILRNSNHEEHSD